MALTGKLFNNEKSNRLVMSIFSTFVKTQGESCRNKQKNSKTERKKKDDEKKKKTQKQIGCYNPVHVQNGVIRRRN